MDCVSPILSIAKDVFDCAAKGASHICVLRENLESLEEEMVILIRRSEDVKRRVQLARNQEMIPKGEVEDWLERVNKEESEVNVIRRTGDALLQQKCPGRCLSVLSTYKLGKRVSKKLMQVRELRSRGDFEEVAYGVTRFVVDELPLGDIVGLNSLYTEVCSCLADDEVRIIGLYGKRGIGKTKLMKKINNGLLGTEHQFDVVIWVTVSKEATVRAAQEVIRNRLEIPDCIWSNASQGEKAILIFRFMRSKRFLLLLDDVHEPLDLSEIGVPAPDARNRSKLILTSRSITTCINIQGKCLRVEPLAIIEAWNLFGRQLGIDSMKSILENPEMQLLTRNILVRCEGLPSAIIAAGQTLAGCTTIRELQQLKKKTEDLIERLISGEDRLSHPHRDEMPLGHTVGLDSLYMRVCKCVLQCQGGIVGLYGIGGIGKTTLMKKIYNEFLKSGYGFNTVIWVTISKQEAVGAAQEVIRNKLQIPDSMWQSRTVDERAREIFNILKTKKFLLLLDNVWQRLDLLEIGVPPLPETEEGSKVIITARFQNICYEMGVQVQEQFRVEVLAWEDAFALLQEKVGKNTIYSHPDIPGLAGKVAERCRGLPLALVIVGRAMADKNSPEAWDQVIQELEKFPAEISGMEDGLFHVLKLSYDNLKDDITKSCFIYYSFFPKEYEIRNDELIEHWIGEGFFDGKDVYEARRRGYKIIEDLKTACLLEESDGFKECVKMHDVIHDMALWIGLECGKKMNKILVYEYLDSERRINWKEAKTISLWGWKIQKLPESPHCFNLLSLFVRECIQLKVFPKEFFQSMPLIRVLDLSTTRGLIELPNGIEKLTNLRYINLSMTQIKELPIGMMKLKQLRCLLLDAMIQIVIPPGLISSLSSLQLFSMYDGNALSAFRATLLEELESIEPLDEISLSFRSVVALNKLLSSCKLQRCIRRLNLQVCENLVLLELSSIFLNYLETLVIFNCLHLEEMKINVAKEGSKDFGETYDIPNPDLIVRNNQHFHRLRDVKIWSCPKLTNLTWLIYAARLQLLNVQFCESLTEVISYRYITSSTQHVSIFTRLTALVLGALPKLESIYQGALPFPSLEVISVINCPRLGRLPFDQNAKCLKKIEGDLTWWESLRWDEEGMEEFYVVYFSPQYLADPMDPPEEMKGKKKLVVEGSTSSATT